MVIIKEAIDKNRELLGETEYNLRLDEINKQDSSYIFTTTEKMLVQEELCKKNKWPNFSRYITCFSCKKEFWNNLSLSKCASEHITGCNICSRSFCD